MKASSGTGSIHNLREYHPSPSLPPLQRLAIHQRSCKCPSPHVIKVTGHKRGDEISAHASRAPHTAATPAGAIKPIERYIHRCCCVTAASRHTCWLDVATKNNKMHSTMHTRVQRLAALPGITPHVQSQSMQVRSGSIDKMSHNGDKTGNETNQMVICICKPSTTGSN